MKASVVELRYKMKEVMEALSRNESVTILYHGKERAVIVPVKDACRQRPSASEHPACGIWKDRDDLKDVPAVVRKWRRRRKNAL